MLKYATSLLRDSNSNLRDSNNIHDSNSNLHDNSNLRDTINFFYCNFCTNMI